MTSLVSRLVVLCVMVAVLATTIAAVSAGRAADMALDLVEDHRAQQAQEALLARMAEALESLDYETRDYATWDELYHRMPLPSQAWSDVNLLPGGHDGALVGVMVLADIQGRITGRFQQGHGGGTAPSEEDPASLAALTALLGWATLGENLGALGWLGIAATTAGAVVAGRPRTP